MLDQVNQPVMGNCHPMNEISKWQHLEFIYQMQILKPLPETRLELFWIERFQRFCFPGNTKSNLNESAVCDSVLVERQIFRMVEFLKRSVELQFAG
jgi:hypothetical protein